MHGERKKQYMNEAHEKAMTAPVKQEPEYDVDLEQRAREAGL
jgi:hypothetical protein